MKLSFSIPSKSKPSSNSNKPSHTFDDDSSATKDTKNPSKHFLTEFDPSKPPTHNNPSKPPTHNNPSKFIIPPIQDQWRPLKRTKNLFLPTPSDSSDTHLGFEHDTSSAAEPTASDISYGLNLRKNNADDDHHNNNAISLRPVPVETVLLQKFKDDLKRLPEDQGFDEFKDVPVEGFGAALLAGYGWSEGMGIGKNAKEDVQVVQYERRTAKEGLGFVSDPPAPVISSKKKEVETPNGKDGFFHGKSVRIVAGRDAGLKGRVLRKIGNDCVVLKLSRSDEEVKVSINDVAELGSLEEERCLKKLKELRIRGVEKDKGLKSKRGGGDERRRGRGGEVEVKRVDVVNGDRRREEQGKKQVSWLRSHIRVRVVSKDFKGGRLYLKKGEVLDVVGPTTCDISMDDSKEIVQGISQDLLETALPRRGGPVLVLGGKHKGVYGNLVERDLEREIGVVRDADTQELHNVRLEQIAEYIGDPSFLGY